ncbi:sulfide:quinone oxidoreductase, mitochondrial-like [Montipora foliosa]|uniref:sulfide:quinone oxidoreductase, mitochondrial-like n=1 Tax=Montipora foliosa TaxID=591990 RepID=UPI0035F16BE4
MFMVRYLNVPYRLGARAFSTSFERKSKQNFQFVVVGGGSGGLSISATLCRKYPHATAIIEPSENHYYQPLWTLVGGGIERLEESVRPTGSLIPPGCTWFKSKVVEFNPDKNIVVTADGKEIGYEFLIVAVGLQLRFDKVVGLERALGTPGVGSNYSPLTVNDTWKAIQNFQEGNAIFTVPNTPIKCLGAPQKIMYLAEAYFREHGVRDKATVMFNTSLDKIFGVKKYADSLMSIVKKRDIQLNFKRNLIEIRPETKEAIFQILDDRPQTETKLETYKYEMIHVTPPMGPPDCLRGSPISDSSGFVDVDKITMRHKKYPNIFAIGDCANSPNGKTAAAVAGQTGVVKANLFALLDGKPMPAQYDGYTSCPLVTGYSKLILAEFDYNGNPLETFPFDQGKERYSMYYMKKDILPEVYWNGLVRGLWPGVSPLRKTLHLGLKD